MSADVILRPIEPGDVRAIADAFAALGWPGKPPALYERYLAEQAEGSRAVAVAAAGGEICGYGTVAWMSDYPPFREAGIPEIQDLNVLPRFRRRGIATRLMDEAERIIAARTAVAGIGVGLYDDYGPAQRMYVLRGYVPDARGAAYDHRPVRGGVLVVADDDLVLYLTKQLHG